MKSIKFLAVVLVFIAVPSFAQTQTADLDVSASVVANCTISTTPVAFGTYDPLAGAPDDDGVGTVSVTCTRGASGLRIDLNTGSYAANAVGTTRAMFEGTSEYLSYELFQDVARSTVWGENAAAGVLVPAPVSGLVAQTFDVFGRIPASQDAVVGNYTDIVVAEINY
ncbi:MAG TPA: spore coat U domain-containing protein [Thermoanaerobaculia bacterium]|nr:spore coat U domain-containing protein [Thermoanaerobaculia bacterium]